MRPAAKRQLDLLLRRERFWMFSAPALVVMTIGATVSVLLLWPRWRGYFALAAGTAVFCEVAIAAICWFFRIGDWRSLARNTSDHLLLDGTGGAGMPTVSLPRECNDASQAADVICSD
jgi:hypothetical protein